MESREMNHNSMNENETQDLIDSSRSISDLNYQKPVEKEQQEPHSLRNESAPSGKIHSFTPSSGGFHQYESIRSVPNKAAQKNGSSAVTNNPHWMKSQSEGFYAWNGSYPTNSNCSTKETASSGAYLAPPGVKIQADMNSGMSLNEMKNSIMRYPQKPNFFHEPSSFKQGSRLEKPAHSHNSKELAHQMKNRRETFYGSCRTGLSSNFANQESSNLPPVISIPILDPNTSMNPHREQNNKNFKRAITMPNALGNQTTIEEIGYSYKEGMADYDCSKQIKGARRISNFSIPDQKIGNFLGLNYPQISVMEEQNQNNSNSQNMHPPDLSYPKRRNCQMFSQPNHDNPWPSVDVPRHSSEFLGNFNPNNPPLQNDNKKNKECNNQLKCNCLVTLQEKNEPKTRNQKGFDQILENKKVRKENSNGSSLQSGSNQSNNIEKKKFTLNAPKTEKHRVKSFNLGSSTPGHKVGINSGAHSDFNDDEQVEISLRKLKTQEQSNLEVNNDKSSSPDDETDLLKECFAL